MNKSFDEMLKKVNGFHEGCHYMALPSGFCTKCGSHAAKPYGDKGERKEREGDWEFNALQQAYGLIGEKLTQTSADLAALRSAGDDLARTARLYRAKLAHAELLDQALATWARANGGEG